MPTSVVVAMIDALSALVAGPTTWQAIAISQIGELQGRVAALGAPTPRASVGG